MTRHFRHFVGWTRPPHPFEVIPSFDNSDSETDQAQAVMLDFVHDDDLVAAAKTVAWQLGGAPAKIDVTVIDPMAFYLAYSDPDTWLALNPAGGYTIDEVRGWFNSQTINDAVQKAIAKRIALGPLPQNEYDDASVTVYYYDNDRLKKVTYPRTSLTTDDGMALDPSNRQWWKASGVTTLQKNDDGSWSDEGFDVAKDLDAAWGVIASVIMAAISAVLIATGVGAAAGAAILAFSAALIAEAQIVADGLNGESTSGAVSAFIDAITKLIGLELPAGAINQATMAGLKYLSVQLKALLPVIQATDSMSFANAAAYIRMNMPALNAGQTALTEQQALSLAAILGNGAGPVFRAGYEAANYGNDDVIDGILGVLPDSDQRTLFRVGATVALLRNQQVLSQVQQLAQAGASANAALQSTPIAQMLRQEAAMTDLLSFCRTTLEPRYGIRP